MAVVTNQQSVAALYTAIFNRAPDLAGLNFWTTQLNAGTSFASIAAGFAQHEVFTTGIGALSNAAYVTALYTNILGSAGDTAGIAYWTARLAGGESKASVVADFVHGSLTIDIPALLAAGSITAADAVAAQIRQDTLTNKATTGVYYATTLGAASNLNPNTVATSKAGLLADPAYNASVNAIAGVDNTAASVQAAKDAINVAVGTGNPVNALLGQTLTLTLNQDTLAGGVSNDNFVANGLQNNIGTLSNSLQSADTLNGGSGADTLKATLVEIVTVTPTLNSIENVNVTFAEAGTLDLANATGTTTLTATGSTAAGVFDTVGTIANLVVANQSQDVTFDDSTATAVKLTLDTVGKAAGPATTVTVANAVATTLNVTANNAIETIAGLTAVTNLSVAATGASNLNSADLAATVTSATVTGAGTVNLSGGTYAALTTLNASTNTGGVTATVSAAALTVTGGTGVDVITYAAAPAATAVVNLGAGNDTLILGAAPAAGVTLNGGDGTDTLALAAANYATVAAFTAPNLAKITGFEVLSITDAGGLADASTVDLSKLAGITGVSFNGVAKDKSATVSNIGANVTVTLQGDLVTNNGAAVLTLKDATGSADVLNLVLNETGALAAGSTTAVGTTAITAAGVETLNVNTTVTSTTAGVTDAKATYALTVADTALTTVKITGNQALTYTTDAAATKLATVDASAATAAVNINLAAVANTSAAVKVTGTALADQFTLTNNAVVTGGLGADKFTIGATANGQTYSTVTDATKGDVFAFTAPATSFTTAKISLGATAVFQDYLDAATAGAAGKVSWFQTATDTYIVEDNSAAATFTNGADTVVKLTGLVDLSTATFAAGSLTV